MERRVALEERIVAAPLSALVRMPDASAVDTWLRAISREIDLEAYRRLEDVGLDQLLDEARVARLAEIGLPRDLARWLVCEAHFQSALAEV